MPEQRRDSAFQEKCVPQCELSAGVAGEKLRG
jgi:hypothetical protein